MFYMGITNKRDGTDLKSDTRTSVRHIYVSGTIEQTGLSLNLLGAPCGRERNQTVCNQTIIHKFTTTWHYNTSVTKSLSQHNSTVTCVWQDLNIVTPLKVQVYIGIIATTLWRVTKSNKLNPLWLYHLFSSTNMPHICFTFHMASLLIIIIIIIKLCSLPNS